MSNSLWPHESQHARPPCPSPAPGVYSNPCPQSRWCHPSISSSVFPFSSCPQSVPASGSFPMSQLFAWGGQSTGVSTSASVLPMNSQDWSMYTYGWFTLLYKQKLTQYCKANILKFKINQFSSVTKSCPTLCNPMDCSMPGFPVHHQLPELAQTHVHWDGDIIQPSVSSPSPPAFNLSQYQSLLQWVSSSHQVAKALELWLQHQSFQWIFRTDFL